LKCNYQIPTIQLLNIIRVEYAETIGKTCRAFQAKAKIWIQTAPLNHSLPLCHLSLIFQNLEHNKNPNFFFFLSSLFFSFFSLFPKDSIFNGFSLQFLRFKVLNHLILLRPIFIRWAKLQTLNFTRNCQVQTSRFVKNQGKKQWKWSQFKQNGEEIHGEEISIFCVE